ncbi:hypothetical protein GOP47_0003677 [Adiantum capillus-veneris]|uniref:Uncharacterized protein n=1 Tax=Adiantum capillus-veneris TaxID=13818 RepID=A0A9D4V6K4_ADICA|nr:hypothetical protein GOP47_0003677 [Adiantum capillus-veneris]
MGFEDSCNWVVSGYVFQEYRSQCKGLLSITNIRMRLWIAVLVQSHPDHLRDLQIFLALESPRVLSLLMGKKTAESLSFSAGLPLSGQGGNHHPLFGWQWSSIILPLEGCP